MGQTLTNIELKTDTLWNGQVGLNQRFIEEALDERKNLSILYERKMERMIIHWQDIEASIAGKSDAPFKDRFGGDPYYLVYFDWKPNIIQGALGF